MYQEREGVGERMLTSQSESSGWPGFWFWVFGFMQARIQDRVSKVKAGLFREMLHRPEGGPSQVKGPEIWGRGGFYGLGNFIG